MKKTNLLPLFSWDDFIVLFSEDVQHKLRERATQADTRAMLAVKDGKNVVCAVLNRDFELDDLIRPGVMGIWIRNAVKDRSSKTAQALALVRGGMSAWQAAKAIGITYSGVHAAIRRQEGKQICPACKQPLRTHVPTPDESIS